MKQEEDFPLERVSFFALELAMRPENSQQTVSLLYINQHHPYFLLLFY